jgi:hypothetical protein
MREQEGTYLHGKGSVYLDHTSETIADGLRKDVSSQPGDWRNKKQCKFSLAAGHATETSELHWDRLAMLQCIGIPLNLAIRLRCRSSKASTY